MNKENSTSFNVSINVFLVAYTNIHNSLTHTYAHTHSLSLSLSLTHTHKHTLSQTHLYYYTRLTGTMSPCQFKMFDSSTNISRKTLIPLFLISSNSCEGYTFKQYVNT